MLVPSTPRWAIKVRAICKILRRVAEPSPGPAPDRVRPDVDVAVEPGSAGCESIVMFSIPPLVDL
jgi:hypothetical protein